MEFEGAKCPAEVSFGVYTGPDLFRSDFKKALLGGHITLPCLLVSWLSS